MSCRRRRAPGLENVPADYLTLPDAEEFRRPGRFAWCAELRTAVDELDVLERPFSPDYDRRRFGVPPTRDELIDGARRRFPQIWSAAA